MYRIFGDSPTIKIVEWLIESQTFDHSITEIAEGTGLSVSVTKRNFEPLVTYGVVRMNRMIKKDAMYVLDVGNRCTKAIIEFDGKIAKCCTIDEEEEQPSPIMILPPEL